ncbi:hypothetical protein KKG61_01655 [bacterium]|nr:hypothetical protein [bacterium]MBU1598805.1 hypothetical protein [bacterium]
MQLGIKNNMELNIEEKKFYQLIKMAVSEVVEENLKRLKLGLIPPASERDMEEIKEVFGKPEKYKDYEFIKQKL